MGFVEHPGKEIISAVNDDIHCHSLYCSQRFAFGKLFNLKSRRTESVNDQERPKSYTTRKIGDLRCSLSIVRHRNSSELGVFELNIGAMLMQAASGVSGANSAAV